MKSITRIAITALALVTLALAATAQTGITPSFTSTADAVHYRGNWYTWHNRIIHVRREGFPSDASGNVDSFYLGALARSYGTAGFSTYGGYGQYEPTKFVQSSVKRIYRRIPSGCMYAAAWEIQFLPLARPFSRALPALAPA